MKADEEEYPGITKKIEDFFRGPGDAYEDGSPTPEHSVCHTCVYENNAMCERYNVRWTDEASCRGYSQKKPKLDPMEEAICKEDCPAYLIMRMLKAVVEAMPVRPGDIQKKPESEEQ